MMNVSSGCIQIVQQLFKRRESAPTIGTSIVGLFVLGQAFVFTFEAFIAATTGNAISILYLGIAGLSIVISYSLFVPRLIGFVGGVLFVGGWIVTAVVFPEFAPINISSPTNSSTAIIVSNTVLSIVFAVILLRNRALFMATDRQ